MFFSADRPKNIIIMIGDGMGLNYVSASVLSDRNSPFIKFNSIGLLKTPSSNKLITDSAAGATAISTGYKVPNKAISNDTADKNYETIFAIAKKEGMSTGIVVTSSVTHATPAAFYANSKSRSEHDNIALQLTYADLNVAIGGGYKYFANSKKHGSRTDDKDLFESMKASGYEIALDYNSLVKIKSGKVLGLLGEDGLNPASKREYSLADLTKIGLKKLSSNPNGFILMVEGSQIDWAGHNNDTDYLLSEMKDFSEAVDLVLEFAKTDGKTLLVVTADHETGGMTITGGEKDGSNLSLSFATTGHTPELVGIFSFGPSQEKFSGIFENHIVGRKLIKLINPDFVFTGDE